MKTVRRLNTLHRVNTDQPLGFRFDGREYQGFQGDTLASALLANGVRRVGRSFKLHRPRGILSAGREEPNALVQLEGGGFDEPNARATTVVLYDGLVAHGQNAWPNVDRDVFGVMNLFQRFLPASFYYKSMMWPSWHWYEWLVRRMAGLGKAPRVPDPQTYHKRNLHCEVLICGGGPAGIAAACAAAKSGLRVVLVDEQEEFGGSLLGENRTINGQPAMDWVAAKLEELAASPEVTLLPRTTVVGYYEHNFLTAVERVNNHLGPSADARQPRERFWRIRARRVVLATGAIERPLVFPNNDRPGIMLASAVRTYANRYGVAAGRRIAIVTNNDSAYHCALDLQAAGVEVAAIVDSRGEVQGTLQSKVEACGIPLYAGFAINRVYGRRELKGIGLSRHLGGGRLGERGSRIDCDVVAMSGGWTPTVHLFSQAGGKLTYDDLQTCFVPANCDQALASVGTSAGDFRLSTCIETGYQAGCEAARLVGVPVQLAATESVSEVPEEPIDACWYIKDARSDHQWVDFQYDVKVSDLEIAHRENLVSVEHVKRYTTNGMSVDQGKTSNVNALAVMAELTGRPVPAVGTTRFRMPYQPATLGVFGGRNVGEWYAPRLYLPAHDWHGEHGAVLEDYGSWQRPVCYPRAGEDEHGAIRREVLAVRRGVGMFDGSPLGKIEVSGPDAAAFLNRIYVNNLRTLKPGSARYGLIANENGVVIDDGVVVRMAEDWFLLHTTSGGASRISQWLEEWLQCEWPNLEVLVENVTTQWANVTVAGPLARQVVDGLVSDIDFSRDAFPHMQFRCGTLMGVSARVLRASFCGEVSYEINVPSRYGLSLWRSVYEAGAESNITPYGVESLMAMRIEKGLLHVGVDTDGTTHPLDLGWEKAIDKKSEDFIGRRSLQRAHDRRLDRLQFVGLEALDAGVPLPVGGHVVSAARPRLPEASQGYVTSGCLSPTLGKSIGLGIVANGRERIGEEVHVFADGRTVAARLVVPAHYDPRGERVHG